MEANKHMVICGKCVDDNHLKKMILKEGSANTCSFCMEKGACVKLQEIAEIVREQLESYLIEGDIEYIYDERAGTPEYYQTGETLLEIIENTAGVSFGIAEALVENVLDLSQSYLNVKHGGMVLNDENKYEIENKEKGYYSRIWDSYCRMMKHEFRFSLPDEFNPLPDVLKWLTEYRTSSGDSILFKLHQGVSNPKLYRGREVKSDEDIIKAMENPEAFFSSPPELKSKAGRMNPQGIPYLYTAFSRETCIAELRGQVGSRILTAQLQPLRTLLLLDLTAVSSEYKPTKSFYDPMYFVEQDLFHFMVEFQKLISQPVLRENSLEYIPTQYVAEYLAHNYEPVIDGLIYKSSQGDDHESNVVLFKRASQIEEGVRLEHEVKVNRVRDLGDELIVLSAEESKRIHSSYPRLHLSKKLYNQISTKVFSIDSASIRMHVVKSIEHSSVEKIIHIAELQEVKLNQEIEDIMS